MKPIHLLIPAAFIVSFCLSALLHADSHWPPAHMADLPADYLERCRAANQVTLDRIRKLKKDDPSVLWVRSATSAYLLGQQVDDVNRVLMSDKFEVTYRPRVGFFLFGPTFIRFYGLFNTRSGLVPGRMPPEVQKKLESHYWRVLKKYSRLKDASRTDLQMRGTENQHLTGLSTNFLVARFLKDHPKYSGKLLDDGSTLKAQYKAWNRYWHAYFDNHTRYGLFKEDSSGYLKYHLYSFINIRDFAEDPMLRKKAEMFLDLIFANWAEETLSTQRGGPKSRTKGEDSFMLASYPLLFDTEINDRQGAIAFSSSGYYPNVVIQKLARQRPERGRYAFSKLAAGRFKKLVQEQSETQAKWRMFDRDNFMVRKGFVTEHYVIGSHQFDVSHPAYNELNQRWQGIVFDNHPRARIEMDGKNLSEGANFNTGYNTNPFKTVQDRNVMVTTRWVTFLRKRIDPYLWVHFTPYLDAVEEEDGWLFVRSGKAYAGVKVVGGDYQWKRKWKSFKTGQKGRASICLNGDFPIITVVNDAADYGHSFDTFKRALKSQPIRWSPNKPEDPIAYKGLMTKPLKWGTGVLEFASITHEGVRKPGEINGMPVTLHPKLVNDSPFIRSKRGSGLYHIRMGDDTLILDFSDSANPQKSVGVKVTPEFPSGAGKVKPIIFSRDG